MAWVKTGTVTVENGSPLVVGSGTGWNNLVESGDVFCVVDANGLPTGGLYEVDRLVRDPEDAYYSEALGETNPEVRLVLAQNYQGSSGGGKSYAILNVTGELTTPRFAGRLQRFLELERYNVEMVNSLLLAADADALAALAQAVSDDADAASGYRADALGAKELAETARDKAQDWAEEAEDTPVETGQYSAKHHALKADASADLAKDYAEKAEDSEVESGTYSAKHWSAKSSGYTDKAREWAENDEDDAVETDEYSAKHWSAKSEGHSDKARDWATKAEDSAVETGLYSALHHASKASASATSAASSETMAEKWAANPEDTEVETGLYSALHYAAKAEDSATSANSAATEATAAANLAFGATAPAWDPLETYDYPDVVAGSDGATYRCTGTGITTDPTTDQSNWKALVLVMLSTFEDDVLGDLMPVESPIESYGWEIDASGDIMPAA